MERARTKRIAWTALRLAVTAGAITWVVHQVDLDAALRDLAAAPWWTFGVPIGLLTLNSGVQGMRLRLLMQGAGVEVPLPRVIRVVLQAQFVAVFLPRGGADVARTLWLSRDTGRMDAVVASILAARLLEIMSWMGLLLYGLAWGVAAAWPWVGASAAVFTGGFAVALVGALLVARYGEGAARRIPIAWLRRQAVTFGGAFARIARSPRHVLAAGALTLPMAAGNVLAAFAVLRAFGLDLPLLDAFALIPAMDTVIMLPVTVSGVGLREGVFVYVMDGLGVEEATALAMALARWCGELGRAAVGGGLFLLGGTLSLPGHPGDAAPPQRVRRGRRSIQEKCPMSDVVKVLVVEDEDDIRNLVAINLRRAGFEVLDAADGEAGLALARQHRPPVVLLDLMLPDLSGREICKRLRADRSTAHAYVIMLTARGEEEDRIAGFEVGADDYVTKPFSVKELVLRVKAASRRVGPAEEPAGVVLDLGRVRIDTEAHRAWVDDEEMELTATEYKLLVYLGGNVGKLCERGELLQQVWDLPPTLNTRTVDTHIKRLRQKLGDAAIYVETVRGSGYRFSVDAG